MGDAERLYNQAHLRAIVNGIAADASDDEVEQDIRKKTKKWPTVQQDLAVADALKIHHENRDLYKGVLTGNITGEDEMQEGKKCSKCGKGVAHKHLEPKRTSKFNRVAGKGGKKSEVLVDALRTSLCDLAEMRGDPAPDLMPDQEDRLYKVTREWRKLHSAGVGRDSSARSKSKEVFSLINRARRGEDTDASLSQAEEIIDGYYEGGAVAVGEAKQKKAKAGKGVAHKNIEPKKHAPVTKVGKSGGKPKQTFKQALQPESVAGKYLSEFDQMSEDYPVAPIDDEGVGEEPSVAPEEEEEDIQRLGKGRYTSKLAPETVRSAYHAAKNGDMEEANTLLDGNGIEYVSSPKGSEIAYVNMGDTYDTTILRDEESGQVWVGSWGDWLEQEEGEYGTEEDMTHCAYCGEWTPDEGEDTVCQNCGHNVDGTEAKSVPAVGDGDESYETWM